VCKECRTGLELVLTLKFSQSLAFTTELSDDRRKGFRVGALLAQPDAQSQSFSVEA
jgi:hypothetical protein